MASPFPKNNPSWLRETTSTAADSIWEGAVVDVWRYAVNQWQAYIKNSRNEERQLVITKIDQHVDSIPPRIDFAEFGVLSLTSSTQQYWMGLSSSWSEDAIFYYVHATGNEISGERTWEANFKLPKAYNGPIVKTRNCPHPAWT